METLARKLIARAAGRSGVSAGDVVICKVDLAMIHDSGGPRRVQHLAVHIHQGRKHLSLSRMSWPQSIASYFWLRSATRNFFAAFQMYCESLGSSGVLGSSGEVPEVRALDMEVRQGGRGYGNRFGLWWIQDICFTPLGGPLAKTTLH